MMKWKKSTKLVEIAADYHAGGFNTFSLKSSWVRREILSHTRSWF